MLALKYRHQASITEMAYPIIRPGPSANLPLEPQCPHATELLALYHNRHTSTSNLTYLSISPGSRFNPSFRLQHPLPVHSKKNVSDIQLNGPLFKLPSQATLLHASNPPNGLDTFNQPQQPQSQSPLQAPTPVNGLLSKVPSRPQLPPSQHDQSLQPRRHPRRLYSTYQLSLLGPFNLCPECYGQLDNEFLRDLHYLQRHILGIRLPEIDNDPFYNIEGTAIDAGGHHGNYNGPAGDRALWFEPSRLCEEPEEYTGDFGDGMFAILCCRSRVLF